MSSWPCVISLSHQQQHRTSSSSALHPIWLVGAALSSWLFWSSESVEAAPLTRINSESPSKPIYRTFPPSTTPAERDACEQLRQSLLLTSLEPGFDEYVRQWAIEDDWCLLRYIRAHKLNVAGAQAGLLATAQWRYTEKIDDIRVDEFKHIYIQGLMYVCTSTDPSGRAIIFNRKSPQPSVGWNPEVFRTELRSLVYTLERAAREMDDRLARGEADPSELDLKWVWIVDMEHYTKGSATPWHVTKSLVDLMRLHYPERLHLAVIIDAPWILRSLLKLLQPLIPKVTRDKVLFVSNRQSDLTSRLLRDAVGGVQNLPIVTNIPGAQVRFDIDEYVRSDPLAKPRPNEKAGKP